MKPLYRLTEGDKEIFKKADLDPNYFTDYYFKGKATGTYWRKIDEHSNIPDIERLIERWQKGYELLRMEWEDLGRPVYFELKDRRYQTIFDYDPDYPTFFDHHGTLVLDWWKKAWNAKQTTIVIIGGYGSSKTWFEMCRNLKKMATTPFYKCLVIAPYAIQANEVMTQAKRLLTGTEYEKRFMQDGGFRNRPYPSITVRNDLCIESVMEFYSIEKNADKLLNLSGDAFHVEQAEQVENIDWLMEIIGSRLRGQVAGRELEGKITFIANSNEAGNPQLWDYFDEGETDPEHVLSLQPEIFDNPYISPRQLIDIAARVTKGGMQNLDRALRGARPIGSGEHFSQESIMKCRDNNLDDVMRDAQMMPNDDVKLITMPKAGVVEWSLPPEKDRFYFLVADPGWSDPPNRNSAAMMVFDVTNFPTIPATMRSFAWVYGNNSPEPWIQKYMELCYKYGCVGRNAFDSTGPQSGYGRMIHGLTDLFPWEVNMGGGKKYIFLNAAKTLISKGLYQFPDIPMLFSQLAKYKLPDEKLRQDLVACLLVASAYIDYMFMNTDADQTEFKKNEDGRYKYHSRERLSVR
jgi:hypothetical protein